MTSFILVMIILLPGAEIGRVDYSGAYRNEQACEIAAIKITVMLETSNGKVRHLCVEQ